MRAAAWYFLRARNGRGLPVDAVARFHLGNGARLERINWLADTSDKAMAQAHGLMVNYLYDLDDIEKNHEAYAETRTVVASQRGAAPVAPAARTGADRRVTPLRIVPYTGTMAPRVTRLSGEARNRIVAATSSTFGQASKSAFGIALRLAGVSMIEGATALTRMPSLATSSASATVSAATPALATV